MTGSDDDGVISLQDIKVVAVKLIGDDTLKKTRRNTCHLFDSCSHTPEMDHLLWSTLIYYNCWREHNKALNDDNVAIPGSLGDGCRETLRHWRDELAQSRINLGEAYSRIILGLGHSESHHCQAGRLRVSRTQTDKEFFEVLYEFILYVVWVTFGYKDWEVVHQQLGSFFRTPQFNRDFNSGNDGAAAVRVEGLGDIKKSSEQYLTYKIVYERPFVGMMKDLHSEAHTSYFPQPKDKYPWVFETACKPPKQEGNFLPTNWSPPERLGIIGDRRTYYDPTTLRYLDEDGAESADETDSIISDIIEDEGDSDSSF
ncbi:protein phosphatase 1 regulatory subunit 36-like isoform X2 [Halichondria panicea]